ncbi:MAG: nitroreductase family protein [Nanoarchaeota archaeon]|nr:nitroreductase family protein [Nanoarchaeota archaeon]
MELKDSILGRRSIRRYKTKPVPVEVLGDILDIARFAPSAGNLQNWQFVIVKDSVKKKEIASACLEQNWMMQAPVLIVICNKYEKVKKLYGKLGKMFSIQDCAIVAANIMLLAKDHSLDTCWVGAFDNEAIQRILELPDSVDPEIILALGYSNDAKHDKHKRKELKELVYFEKWGNKEADFSKKSIKDKLKSLLKK